jgi:hypothetical protein
MRLDRQSELTPLYVTPHVAKRGCMAGELADLMSSQVAIRSLNSLNSISVVMSGVAAKTTTATTTTTALQELISMPTAPYISVLGVSPAPLPSESCGDTNKKRDQSGDEPGPSVSTAWPAAGHVLRITDVERSAFAHSYSTKCVRPYGDRSHIARTTSSVLKPRTRSWCPAATTQASIAASGVACVALRDTVSGPDEANIAGGREEGL